jgi:flavin-binding protein dodecin
MASVPFARYASIRCEYAIVVADGAADQVRPRGNRAIMESPAQREEKHSDVNVTTLTEEITTTTPGGLIGTSFTSSDLAVAQAIAKASAQLSGVQSVEVKSVEVMVGEGGSIDGYRVTLQVHHAGEALTRIHPTS